MNQSIPFAINFYINHNIYLLYKIDIKNAIKTLF